MSSRVELEASFHSLREAQQARQRLLELRCSLEPRIETRGTEGPATLSLSVEPAHYAQSRDALIAAGAAKVSVAGQADPGWMSHHNGRVTGASVTPGAGDSEAGAADAGPRQI